MSTLFVGRGDCRLGTTRRDAEGNVVEQTGAKWEPNAEGGCVAICDMDPDKMEPTGAAEVFGDWDAAHFLARVLEKLGPGRPVNVPDFREILKAETCGGADEDFFCEYCKQYGYAPRGLHYHRGRPRPGYPVSGGFYIPKAPICRQGWGMDMGLGSGGREKPRHQDPRIRHEKEADAGALQH